jgi:hypothetical protein
VTNPYTTPSRPAGVIWYSGRFFPERRDSTGIPRAYVVAMTENIIVMPGQREADLPVLRSVAGEFGWTADPVRGLNEAVAAQAYVRTLAAILHRDGLGADYSWPDAVRRVKRALPDVRVIVCHGLSEPIEWQALCEAGTFHAVSAPLKECEVRQSLGFVWEAEKRVASVDRDASVIVMPALRPSAIQPKLRTLSRPPDAPLVNYAGG